MLITFSKQICHNILLLLDNAVHRIQSLGRFLKDLKSLVSLILLGHLLNELNSTKWYSYLSLLNLTIFLIFSGSGFAKFAKRKCAFERTIDQKQASFGLHWKNQCGISYCRRYCNGDLE